MNIIKANNINHSYIFAQREIKSLYNISFKIEKGEFISIVGMNGCGKSTLVKHLNALIPLQSGELTIASLDCGNNKNIYKIRQKCGMVFQNPDNQLVATVVDEDVAFGLENLGVPHDEMVKRVADALKAVGMSDYAKSAPHKLSGGQKQRVAIAGIIAMEPQCIVFDEPTAMLDPKGRKEVMEVILKLCREKGITVILITHYMNEAAMADRVVIMDKGSIILDGTPREVFSNVETLQSTGLDVPQPTALATLLKKAGMDLKDGILTVDECAKAVTEALKGEI